MYRSNAICLASVVSIVICFLYGATVIARSGQPIQREQALITEQSTNPPSDTKTNLSHAQSHLPDYTTVQIGWSQEQVVQAYGQPKSTNMTAYGDEQWGYDGEQTQNMSLTFHQAHLVAIMVLAQDFRQIRYVRGGSKPPEERSTVADAIETLAPGRLASEGAKENTVLMALGDPDKKVGDQWDYQCRDGWLRLWIDQGRVIRAEPLSN